MKPSQLIRELKKSAHQAGFSLSEFGQTRNWPLLALSRRSTSPKAKNIYISAGIHGDEPAGPLAVLELLKNDSLPKNHHYWICPLLNPEGLEKGIRENPDGIDLNRDYEARRSPEIQAHTEWISSSLDSIEIGLHLHEDWESTGFYLYEERTEDQSTHAQDILHTARKYMPIDTSSKIDGWPAQDGLIKVSDLPQDQVGTAESGFLSKHFGSQNYTLESPSSLSIEIRINALRAAALTVAKFA